MSERFYVVMVEHKSLDALAKGFGNWFKKQRYQDHENGSAFGDATRDYLELNDGEPPSLSRLQAFRRKVGKIWSSAREKVRERKKARKDKEEKERAAKAREPELDL